jgi:vacuolar protein sorting-associated protein 72
MANDEDERKSSSLDELSDVESSSSDGESEAGEPQPVEWLVTSRSKRATAGNRMKAMLANEEPAAEDSDLELLFAEDENDAGFTDEEQEDASDVQMDSSSDEEDKEENADDLEGEKELERQAREKRAAERKRKTQDAIPAKFRKKVRIEQPAARPPRPKKKSERTSWLPSPADMPTRASERQTTRISKQQLHQKMVSDELRRRKQLEKMEKKAKLLEAMKKPPMTQAERLAEAAIVEKRNSKSLNRWEEAEKQREEERLKKIAALNSRKLDGPVVTFWSGIQELQEGQSKHVGNLVSMEEKAPRKKRQSAAAALAAKEAEAASTPTTPVETPGANTLQTPDVKTEQPDTPSMSTTGPVPPLSTPVDPTPGPSTATAPPVTGPSTPGTPAAAPAPTPMAPPPIPPPPNTRPSSSGVLAAPILAPPAGVSPTMLGGQLPMLGLPAGAKPFFLAAPNTSHTPSPLSMPPSTPSATAPPAPPTTVPPPAASTPKPKIIDPVLPVPSTPATPLQTPLSKQLQLAKPPDTPQEAPPSAEPPREGKVTRSCIILQNFDDQAIKDKQVQTQILFGRKMNKLASKFPQPFRHK